MDKLREDGCEELAEMVTEVVEAVEHAVGGGEMDVEEVQGALVDAKAAAAKLREEGKEEEAAKLDEMVDKLEGALHAQVEAEDLKKEGELVRAAAEASEQASEAAKAAGDVARKLGEADCHD